MKRRGSTIEVTDAMNKKIKQAIASDEFTIGHYKNLRHDLSGYKRVHVGKSFVLMFKVCELPAAEAAGVP